MRTLTLVCACMFASASAALAQATNSGDWRVVTADDGSGDVIAGTFTEGGSEILAYRCFASSGNCSYVLMPDTDCVSGNEYPMLVNAEAGAALVTGTCYRTSTKSQYGLQPYKPIETAINGGTGMIGFALPMASGGFKAVRFSVRGGRVAIQAAETLVVQRRKGTTIDSPGRARASTF